jgi:glyceraldehyde 3-phosphate dehydrogenase
MIVGGKEVKVLSEPNPGKLPWRKLGVDIVIESSGVFHDRIGASKHLKAGARKVIITAPCDSPDYNVVPGVRDNIGKKDKIIAVASCTTNCLAPLVKVIDENFGIKDAMFTTIHAYTNDQKIQDHSHEKPRRGRAGALNLIPTTTGASEAVVSVYPKVRGKIKGLAIRVPVAVGSIVDFVVEVKKKVTKAKVNGALKKAGKDMQGIVQYSEDELVSTDIIGNSHSVVVDGLSTSVEGNLIKVLGWYDNEYGYSCRVADVVGILSNLE